MAEIKNKINMTDGVLLPEKSEKTIFSAWKISFFGALILVVFLPLAPFGAINKAVLTVKNVLGIALNYSYIQENKTISAEVFELSIIPSVKKDTAADLIRKYYVKSANGKSYSLIEIIPKTLGAVDYNRAVKQSNNKRAGLIKNYYRLDLTDGTYKIDGSLSERELAKLFRALIKTGILNYKEIYEVISNLYSADYPKNVYREIVVFIPDGLLTTFEVTLLSIFFSIIIGLISGLGRISRIAVINRISTIYVEIIRGIPLLMQLFYIYYAMAKFVKLPPMVSAITAMSICYGAYISEIFRAGIKAIPKGQMEAALALGFSRGQAIFLIILPQALKVVVPPIGNEFIAMLKDSSLVSIIAVADLLRRGREFASKSFNYFETYTYIALVYLILTLFFSRIIAVVEEKLNKNGKVSN